MSMAGSFQHAWRGFPVGGLDDIIGPGTCVVLAPHPDDESLGCGGLIAACVAAGRAPLVVVLTDGAASHPGSRAYPPERLRAVRAAEVRAAVACLGLPDDRVVLLGLADTAAPLGGPTFDAVVRQLIDLCRREADCSAILAPWRHDPHCDHEAASVMAAAVATKLRIRHVAYPVWGWTLPADAVVADAAGVGWRLDVGRFLPVKRAAIRAHQSQYGALITDDPGGFRLPAGLLSVFDAPFETFIPAGGADAVTQSKHATPAAMSRPVSHFERLYQSNPDPWGFGSSPYEQSKYRHTLEALGNRHFTAGLEVGCSIGVLTRMLAERCDGLLGIDCVEQPLLDARARCSDQPGVRFARMAVPNEWPAERFDLIVFSEVLYFLSAGDIGRCASRVLDSLLPDGIVVLVNWLGPTDDPSAGDAAPDRFVGATTAGLRVVRQERLEQYRLDVLKRL